ncbi:MAG: PepSY-associated TM helix domain-containing protein, partial [Giesbergeria sp.]
QRWGWPVLMGLAGALWAALPLISAVTTPAHLGRTLAQGAWPWALADLAFACTGLALLGVAHKLRPRPAAAAQRAPRTQGADLPPAPSAAPGG